MIKAAAELNLVARMTHVKGPITLIIAAVRWQVINWGGALLTLSSLLCEAQTAITVGRMDTKDGFPLGLTADGAPRYLGEYQQIYASSVFPGTAVITQIAFSAYFPFDRTVNYALSIGLSTTARTPTAPGTQFAGGLTTVFSGSLSSELTSTSDDFDLVIDLATPFTYDPARGNLLLDVYVSSASGAPSITSSIFDVQNVSFVMGRLLTNGNSIVSIPNQGLVTRFIVIVVPSLAVKLTGANVSLSWPTNTSGFSLQSSTNLTFPNEWFAVTNTASLVGTNYSVSLSAMSERQFFRLRR